MKYSLTIASDNPNDIIALLQTTYLSGGAVSIVSAAIPGNNASDDDETGPVAAVAPGEVDVTGLPWDERIHAKTKTKTQDGKWKRGRNVSDDLVTAVEGQLRAALANATAPTVAPAVAPTPVVPTPAPVPAPVAAPAPVVPVVAAPPHDPIAAATADGWILHPTSPGYYYKGQEVVTTEALAAKYPAPVAAPTVPSAPAAPAMFSDFAGLMQAISNGVAAGKIDQDGKYVAELAAYLGVEVITAIAADPAKIAQAAQHMQANGKL